MAKQFDRLISCMVAVGVDSDFPKSAVGFADGVVAVRFEGGKAFIFDNNDQNLSNAKLATGPVLMAHDRYNLYCGESNGTVTALPLLDPNIGDIDGNGTVNLADAIVALKALSGIHPVFGPTIWHPVPMSTKTCRTNRTSSIPTRALPGSVFASATVTFTWNNVGAEQYWLRGGREVSTCIRPAKERTHHGPFPACQPPQKPCMSDCFR